MDAAVAAQSMPGEAEIANAPAAVSVDGAAAASLALRASGRQVSVMSSGLSNYGTRWARVDGAKVNVPMRLRREAPHLRHRPGQERKRKRARSAQLPRKNQPQ